MKKPEIDGYCCDQRRRSFCGSYIGAQGIRVCDHCGKAVNIDGTVEQPSPPSENPS